MRGGERRSSVAWGPGASVSDNRPERPWRTGCAASCDASTTCLNATTLHTWAAHWMKHPDHYLEQMTRFPAWQGIVPCGVAEEPDSWIMMGTMFSPAPPATTPVSRPVDSDSIR